MNVAFKAIYEGGKLRPLEPLTLAENTVVQLSLETADPRLFHEHECVRLAVAQRETGLQSGTTGTVVHVYPDHKAYEVEFPDGEGDPQVLTLTPTDLEPLEA